MKYNFIALKAKLIKPLLLDVRM